MYLAEQFKNFLDDYTLKIIGTDKKFIPKKFHCKNINYIGSISNVNKLVNFYDKSRIFILPSYIEGFPKVIPEAITYGCVPIVSNSGSVGQYLTTDFGIILDNISPKTISNTLIKIEKNRNILKNKAAKGHQLAALFSYERYNQKIKSLLTKYA